MGVYVQGGGGVGNETLTLVGRCQPMLGWGRKAEWAWGVFILKFCQAVWIWPTLEHQPTTREAKKGSGSTPQTVSPVYRTCSLVDRTECLLYQTIPLADDGGTAVDQRMLNKGSII
jgi:hypothetical protein